MIDGVLLIAIALAAPLIARRLSGDLFPPAAIVAAAWGLTLGLLGLDLLAYAPIPARTWIVIAAAVGSLMAGALAGQTAMARRAPASSVATPVRAPLAVTLIASLGLAGVGWYVWTVVSHDGWELFRRGEELRYLLNVRLISSRYLFLQQCCSAAALLACAFALAGVRLGPIAIVAALLAAAGTLTSTDRTQIFTVVLSALFMYFLRRGPTLRTGRLAALGGAALVVLGLAFFSIGTWTGKSAGALGLRLRLPDAAADTVTGRVVDTLQGGSVAYFYATGSYPALSQLLAAGHPRQHGRHTFYPVLRLLQRAGVLTVDLPEAIPPFVPIVTRTDGTALNTNAYTFLYYPLEDFGPPGALIYAGIVGACCGVVFGWARRDRTSPLRLVVAGQVSTALALTFFVNKFNSTAFWYVLAWTAVPFAIGAVEARLRGRDAAAAAAPPSAASS